MSLKSLPARAPVSKVLPRKRSVGESIVATLELAALVRTISGVLGRRKRRRLPGRGGLLALAGGGVLAAIVGVLVSRRNSGPDFREPPAGSAPGAVVGREDDDSAPDQTRVADPVPAAVAASGALNDTAPGADPEAAAELEVDAPNEGATGDHPTQDEQS